MKKKKSLDSFQAELREDKWIAEQRKRAEPESFYLDCSNISTDCYEWWLVVLKHYDLKSHEPIPIWMKELFIPW